MLFHRLPGALLFGFTLAVSSSVAAPPRLKVSDNHHFLVTENGTPFFWLGDTAWEIFHRLTREDAERYLENRAPLAFTPPNPGKSLDWVLVLDDAAKNLPPPGQPAKAP